MIWMGRIALVLAVAAVVHVTAVWAVPRLIMIRAMAVMERQGGYNTALHPPRPSDKSRDIVLPSPDLLYTACVFDLRKRPLRITAPAPDTYWSVAFFAANTDNFFVLNDRGANGHPAELVLAGPGTHDQAPPGARIVDAPTDRGIVLFRTLVPSDKALPGLIGMQKQQECAPL